MSHPARPVRQEGVRYNSQLAAAIKMTHRAANQRLRRIQAGLHPIVERRVGDDHIKTTFHLGKDVAGKDFTFNTVGRKVLRDWLLPLVQKHHTE